MTKISLNPAVALYERLLPGSTNFSVRAACVTGENQRIVIDTLITPDDMRSFTSASLVVYTHSDWDHCWGTRAFPGVPVIGQRLTRERLASPAAAAELAEKQAKDPTGFRGAAIVLPDLIFDQALTIDAGGVTLHLHHVPGHTADAIVVHVPEYDLLLAGDVVENPIPAINEPGHIVEWAASLRRWEQSGVQTVVPSHGAIGGPELLAANAAYLEAVIAHVGRGLDLGHDLAQLQAELPVERLLPDVDKYPAFYRDAHAGNVAAAVTDLQARRHG